MGYFTWLISLLSQYLCCSCYRKCFSPIELGIMLLCLVFLCSITVCYVKVTFYMADSTFVEYHRYVHNWFPFCNKSGEEPGGVAKKKAKVKGILNVFVCGNLCRWCLKCMHVANTDCRLCLLILAVLTKCCLMEQQAIVPPIFVPPIVT